MNIYQVYKFFSVLINFLPVCPHFTERLYSWTYSGLLAMSIGVSKFKLRQENFYLEPRWRRTTPDEPQLALLCAPRSTNVLQNIVTAMKTVGK